MVSRKAQRTVGNSIPTKINRLGIVAGLMGAMALGGSGAVLGAVGDPAIVVQSGSAIGVAGTPQETSYGTDWGGHTEINFNPRTCQSQALSLDFGVAVSEATVAFARFEAGENEWGAWEAFDGSGQPLQSEAFAASSGPLTIQLAGDATYRYLVFTALPYGNGSCTSGNSDNDSSDYDVASIAYTASDTLTNIPTDQAWAVLAPAGFDFGVAYTTPSGRFVDAPIVIEDDLCEGGEGGGSGSSCEVELSAGVKLIIENSPDISGTLAVNGSSRIEDPRAACRSDDGIDDDRIQPDGSLNLGFDLGNGYTGPVIPATLCGQPDGKKAFFNLLDLDSDLLISRSALELEFETDPGSPFQCTDAGTILSSDPAQRRSELPVAAWLPKTSRLEVPVLDADGNLVARVQDKVFACGSTRTKFSKLSYVVYNLRYVPGTDFVAVISDEIAQIGTTIKQVDAGNCISRGGEALLNLSAAVITDTFDRRANFKATKLQLLGLLKLVESGPYVKALERCLFDPSNNQVMGGGPTVPEGLLARNFGGDLVAQISHTLYMIDRMLGVVNPELPSDF